MHKNKFQIFLGFPCVYVILTKHTDSTIGLSLIYLIKFFHVFCFFCSALLPLSFTLEECLTHVCGRGGGRDLCVQSLYAYSNQI